MAQRMAQSEAPRIPVDEAKRFHDRGEAIMVDVRAPEAYDEAHVKGAINLPLQQMPRRYQELPRDKYIVTY